MCREAMSLVADGGGGTIAASKLRTVRTGVLLSTRGVGGITALLIAGSARDHLKPSAGGGPGIGLKASRLATAASDFGKLTFGASTTFSRTRSPRATRIACVG